jgi:uncharacterized sporulation protein YeaH/YhbH (DUF444 family)
VSEQENKTKGRKRARRLTHKDAGLSKADERLIIEGLNKHFGPQFTSQVFPEPTYLDRTKPDRDRVWEKIRRSVTKDHIKDLMRRGGNILSSKELPGFMGPTFAFAADAEAPMASIPISIPEPHWRPGRDRPGGGGHGIEASNEESDLVFIDFDYKSLAELLDLLYNLPFLLPKEENKILSMKLRVRGVKKNGPKARLDLPATYKERIKRFRATYNARPEDFPGLAYDDIPTVEQFPYDDMDMRYKRVEEKWDPDSDAVVFFLLDHSGSMNGEPVAIAKFYFLLNLIWLRACYPNVTVVFIPHYGVPWRAETEEEFFTIEGSGGTDFVPAYRLSMEIANREFPVSKYNRYMFHATDGWEDHPPSIAAAQEEVLAEGKGDFTFLGILLVWVWGWNFKSHMEQAVDLLSPKALRRVSVAKVATQDEVPDAMRDIMEKHSAVDA